MRIRLYNPNEHLGQIKAWLSARSLAFDAAELPELGLIVDNVAVGFMRRCEGGVGIFDSYLSNPDATAEERNAALDEITAGLIKTASVSGFTRILAVTSEPSIAQRAVAHGFRVPHMVTLIYDKSVQETPKE